MREWPKLVSGSFVRDSIGVNGRESENAPMKMK